MSACGHLEHPLPHDGKGYVGNAALRVTKLEWVNSLELCVVKFVKFTREHDGLKKLEKFKVMGALHIRGSLLKKQI